MGLAPTASPGSELFIDTLKKQGIIDLATFNINYRDIDDKFSMAFGGIDIERVPYLDNFTFTELYDDYSWSVRVSSMKYGDLEFGQQVKRGVLNTPDDFIRLPPEDYKRWFSHVISGKSCIVYQGSYGWKCQSIAEGKYEPMYITIGNYEYKISPEIYITLLYLDRVTYCRILVTESQDPSNSTVGLGLAFLKNFNVYYDMENKQIGLYGEHMKCTASDCGLQKGENTEDGDTNDKDTENKINKNSNTELHLMTCLFIASFILNLIFICCCCWSRKEKDEKDDKEEPLLIQEQDSV